MSSAAADLPIEAIFSMVMEGLHTLAAYRRDKQLVGAEQALRVAVASPRPLFTYFLNLVHDFVSVHDMDNEDSLQEFGATVALGSKTISSDIDRVFSAAGIVGSNRALSPAEDNAEGNRRTQQQGVSLEITPGGAGGKGQRYYAILAAVRDAFENAEEDDNDRDATAVKRSSRGTRGISAGLHRTYTSSSSRCASRGPGMPESLFCEFVAPALTLSRDSRVNQRFIARTNVTQSGFITWDAFSNFFVKLHGDTTEEATQIQFVSPASAVQHNAAVRKLLFTRQRCATRFAGGADDRSVNAAMDRYCLSGGYDGTVHMWDTNFYDHAVRLHYIPHANKSKRWVNDMSYTCAGRLAIAQSRGLVYVYSLMNPLKPYMHRAFRSNSQLSEDEECAVRAELERVRMQQGKTRFTAADCPSSEFCVLNSPLPGDITTVHGPRSLAKFSHSSHMEPLLVGLDTGLVHLYNVYKPIEFKAQVSPMATFFGFAKSEVFQVTDHPLDNTYLVAGRDVRGLPSIQIVDYEKSEAAMVLQPSRSALANPLGGGLVPSLTRFDFDDSIGLIAASGATRSATIFSTSFPEPVTILADHSAPVVGAAVNASQYQIFTFTEDHTFHFFDLRMFRKVQTFCDTSSTRSDASGIGSGFACGAFDGTRGVAVAAASTPVALQIHQQQSFGPSVSGGGGSRSAPVGSQAQSKEAMTPSGLATELRRVQYCHTYQSLITAEGNFLVTRSGEGFRRQDAVASMPSTIVDIAADPGERRTAVLLQGRQLQILSTMGGSRVGKWACVGLDSMDEGTCVCFAHRPGNQPVVAVGTFTGALAIYDVTSDGELVSVLTFGSAVLCVAPAGVGQQRLLVGTAAGDVFLVNLDTITSVKVFDFDTVHEQFRDALDFGGMKEKDAETAMERKKMARMDSLMTFRNRAYASMDKSVEAFADGFDPSQSIILFGSGATLLVRISHAEVVPLLQFPAVCRHTSASAIAVRRGGMGAGSQPMLQCAVGDFNGCVTVFRIEKVTGRTTSPSSVHAAIGRDSVSGRGGRPSTRRPSSDGREPSPSAVPPSAAAQQRLLSTASSSSTASVVPSYEDYKVVMVNLVGLSKTSLVGNISFIDSETLCAALNEQLQVVTFSVDGWVNSVLSHESNQKSEESAALSASLHTQLQRSQEEQLEYGTHPFFRMVKGATSMELSPSIGQPQPRPSHSPSAADTLDDSSAQLANRGATPSAIFITPPQAPLDAPPPDPSAQSVGQNEQSGKPYKPQFVEIIPLPLGSGNTSKRPSSSVGLASSTTDGSDFNPGGASLAKPTFRLPNGSGNIVFAGSMQTSPRTIKKATYPATKMDVIQPLHLGCNDVYHPEDAKYISAVVAGGGSAGVHSLEPKGSTTNSWSRPHSARNNIVSERLYPQPPPPATSRPPSASKPSVVGGRSTAVAQAPLIQYNGLTVNPAIVTSDVNRLRPPTYSPRLARPPSAPTFPYQRKTLEMSHRTDTLLQDAVDKATHISSRIVSNIRQRRLVSSNTSGGRKGDGRVFLTLEQQPLPQELVRAVALSNASPRKRDKGGS